MRFNRIERVSFFAVCLFASPGWAHPGHGMTAPSTPVHYLVEPRHGWWVVVTLAIAAALFVRRYLKHHGRREQSASAASTHAPRDC